MNLLARVWRLSERVGLVPTLLCAVAWLAAGGLGARAVAVSLVEHPMLAKLAVGLIAPIAAIGCLVAFWLIAAHIDYRRRGYRVTCVSGKDWLYEERISAREARCLPYVRVIVGAGYPAPCDIRISGEATWQTEVPSWAQRRRAEITDRIAECHGRKTGVQVRFVDS
jgi:hypothetical protein